MNIDKKEIEERLLFVLNAELKRMGLEMNSFHQNLQFDIKVTDHDLIKKSVQGPGKYSREDLNERFGGKVIDTHKLKIDVTLSYEEEERTNVLNRGGVNGMRSLL